MKAIKAIGWTMIGTGTLILLFLAYQLVFTNFITARAQDAAAEQLDERFDALRQALPEPERVEVLPPTAEATEDTTPDPEGEVALFSEPAPESGEEFGRLIVPALDLEHIMFEGVDRVTLKNGPGHMPWTPLPGQPGNAVLSGHRTTYGAPFFNFDQLAAGDEIIVETLLGSHTYAVRESVIVKPTDVWVTEPKVGAWLTLTTCNPRFSARERLVVFAELVDGPNFAYAQAAKDGLIDLVRA
ncbi:MAG: class E sortase [Acidimicrobiia bacterium]|nr:class E sortase [Acidimicrobiia bacterium]